MSTSRCKMINDFRQKTIRAFVEKIICESLVLSTDEYSSYQEALAKGEYAHQPKKFDLKANAGHLLWLYQIIGNAKMFILGTYHGLDAKHLPVYLSEYCFRTIRRHFVGQIFNRLLNACMVSFPITYRMLVNLVPSG